MIIPAWQYKLAVQTNEAVQNDGPVRVWLRNVVKWHWGILGIPPLLVWMCGSGYLMFHLWKTHPEDKYRKKVLWTIVLVLPLLGWMLYGQYYGESRDQEPWIKFKQ